MARLKSAMNAVVPKPSRSEPAIYPDGMMVARAVCRILAPDETLQFFTRERSSRWVGKAMEKKVFSVTCPRLYGLIVGLISHNAGKDTDASLSLFGKHLAKCADRKRSKELVSNM